MTDATRTDCPNPEPVSWEQYLRESAVPRGTIDDFLQRPNWTRFDPELGYILHNSSAKWGENGSRTIATFRPDGARSRFLYSARTPRINSYGNSFTECNQVNDGETWQEYLAGHFGEPIGNYGVGGHGVYQAYRRMLRQENTEHGAKYVILYIWGDDPIRSLMRARWAAIYRWLAGADVRDKGLFQGNPWAHIEMDLSTGCLVERKSPLSTPESLYKMCEPEWMLDHLRDDLAVQLSAYAGMPEFGQPGVIRDLDRPKVDRLADALNCNFDWNSDVDRRKQSAIRLLNVYGQRATTYVLDKAKAFAQTRSKKLLVVLNYTARQDAFKLPIVPYNGARLDQEVLQHLKTEDFDYFDMNAVHQREFDGMITSYSAYMRQFQVAGVGHYNARGNHFFAYAIKDKLLEMLEPKPLPYLESQDGGIDFEGYLPGA